MPAKEVPVIDPDDDKLADMVSTDHVPTVDELIDRMTAQMAELERMRAEYAALTPEQQAAVPESARRILESRS